VPTALASPPPEIDDLTPDQTALAIGWAKEDLAAGKITQEQANKQRDAGQRALDTRSEEMKQLDAQFPPARD
jgi:hypothetical protein